MGGKRSSRKEHKEHKGGQGQERLAWIFCSLFIVDNGSGLRECGDKMKTAINTLVVTPARATFTRPLGELSTLEAG